MATETHQPTIRRSDTTPRQLERYNTALELPEGTFLNGKQEHYLKRELIAQQTHWEIQELNSPTALQRFGAPFRSDVGEVPPEDSELPLLRYIFVHHVRSFPFLDQAREKEFWQDKLQVFLESFATKHISSSEDRLEETKRRKLALKAEKLVELMMVSGIPTASGYEERIRFSEMEVVDRGANEQGLVVNVPEGHNINGWDVNVAGVRIISVKRNIRKHRHAEFLLRVRQRGSKQDLYVARRYGAFSRLHKVLKTEIPGKILPPLPRKNKSSSGYSFMGGGSGEYDSDDDASISSVSTQQSGANGHTTTTGGSSGLNPFGFWSSHTRSRSSSSVQKGAGSPVTPGTPQSGRARAPSAASSALNLKSPGTEERDITLHREEQRVSLRAFLRTILQNERIASSQALKTFLTKDSFVPTQAEIDDMNERKNADERRIAEQKRFYEIARKRAKELDEHMEKFRRDIVERNGLTKLFNEIKVKNTIQELSPEYQKFAEWLRIEVAATIYHIFLAEDNSPELFAQAKRIHSLVPYVALKNVVRFANPAAVMKGVLDLFLAQPLGTRSLMQRIFSLAINDGVRQIQRSIDAVVAKVDEGTYAEKLKNFVAADDETKEQVRQEAEEEQVDLVVAILKSNRIEPEQLEDQQVGEVFNAYVAWNHAVENVNEEMKQGAELYSQLKQLLKLYTRYRDKEMMMSIIEEPVTLRLFRDLFTIFYEPLVRVYKSANVYTSVTDFGDFVDDTIKTIEAAQRQDVSADPNQTVQAFIDLCARHEHNFYKFVHEVHIHDNGLFDQLMGWIETILEFLRHGPSGGKLDMNALFQGAVDTKQINPELALEEIDTLVTWQMARKQWHNDKTRRKMAAEGADTAGSGSAHTPLASASFKTSDFGLNDLDIEDLGLYDGRDESDAEDAEMDELEATDPIAAERKRRLRIQEALKSRKGEPEKPPVKELRKLREGFISMLRAVLAE